MYIPTLKISKSWFYSAGEQFGWATDGFDIKGIGIAKQLLLDYRKLYVQVDGILYLLDCMEAQRFVLKYEAKQMIGKVKVCIVSKSLLHQVDAHGNLVPETELLEQLSLIK